MKTFLKVWLGLTVIAGLIMLYRGDIVISDEDAAQTVVELPMVETEAPQDSSSTEITQDGSIRSFYTSLDLAEIDWTSACRDPDDHNSCSLAYRSTYRLPAELGDSSLDRHFSLWVGYNKRPRVTVSMDWFDKEVTVDEEGGVPTKDDTYALLALHRVGSQDDMGRVFKSDSCRFLPKNRSFPRGSVNCIFEGDAEEIIEALGDPLNWGEQNQIKVGLMAWREQAFKQVKEQHMFQAMVPGGHETFQNLLGSVMDPIQEETKKQRSAQAAAEEAQLAIEIRQAQEAAEAARFRPDFYPDKNRDGESITWHDIEMEPTDWTEGCTDPKKPFTCFVAYRTTYVLPVELDAGQSARPLSLWMGFMGNPATSLTTINIEWLDRVVTVTERTKTAHARGFYASKGIMRELDSSAPWIESDQCLHFPKNDRFTSGGVQCRFEWNADDISADVPNASSWMDGQELAFSTAIRVIDSFDGSVNIHGLHFGIPVSHFFVAKHKRSILDASDKEEKRRQALNRPRPSVLDRLGVQMEDFERKADNDDNCENIANERAQIACYTGEDESNIVLIETDGSINGCPRHFGELNYDYKADMAEARSCAGVDSYKCESFRHVTPRWYGKKARIFYNCQNPSSGNHMLENGRKLCREAALDADGRGDCDYRFGSATSVF